MVKGKERKVSGKRRRRRRRRRRKEEGKGRPWLLRAAQRGGCAAERMAGFIGTMGLAGVTVKGLPHGERIPRCLKVLTAESQKGCLNPLGMEPITFPIDQTLVNFFMYFGLL